LQLVTLSLFILKFNYYFEVNYVGEVYRPEDIVGGKKKPSDLSPNLKWVTPTTLQDVIREIRLLRAEVTKIKQVLRANGIAIE
jgi:hypothetical protein